MTAPESSWQAFRAGWLRFWRSPDRRVVVVRDLVVAGGLVALLLGGLWVYTGQPFPDRAPLVVVESGSMMHGPYGPCLEGDACSRFGSPAFGRVGTIDPGDLILVKRVGGLEDVETAFGSGGRSGYGGHGDVVVYQPERTLSARPATPIIHRAMLLVRVEPDGCIPGGGERPCRFVVPETCDPDFGRWVRGDGANGTWRDYCAGSARPISLELERDGLFLKLIRYPCGVGGGCPNALASGLLTKGDNNDDLDQGGPVTCCPVSAESLIGEARGELPWFGLIKLSIQGNPGYGCRGGLGCRDPTRDTQWTFLGATAPWDIWVSLVLAVGLIIALPVGIDYARAYWRRRSRPSMAPNSQEPPSLPPDPDLSQKNGPPPSD